MNTLDEEELEGVLAHELAHIKNRDTLINSFVATLAGGLAILAEMVFWGALFSGRDQEGEMLSSLALVVLTPLIATLVKTAISRKMEYRADTDAVQMTGSDKLGSALKKIDRKASSGRKQHVSKVQQASSNLFITNPFGSMNLTKFFSTHPPLESRVENIQKSLNS